MEIDLPKVNAKLLPDDLLNEMRKERSPGDFLAWVDSTLDAYAPVERSTKLAKEEQDLLKLLREELRPLALFGIWLSKQHERLMIRPSASKTTRIDAMLRCTAWTSEQPIEIAQAIDGYQEHLRYLHLREFGHAPALGEIIHTRRGGRTRVSETELVAHESTKVRTAIYNLIIGAARAKLEKDYPDDCWLLIVFDDHIGFRRGDRPNDEAMQEITRFYATQILPLPWKVAAVYLVGSSGRTIVGGPIGAK